MDDAHAEFPIVTPPSQSPEVKPNLNIGDIAIIHTPSLSGARRYVAFAHDLKLQLTSPKQLFRILTKLRLNFPTQVLLE